MNNQINLRVALFEPRIPQNTGNIARTSAAFNFTLDLIKPMGFSIDDKNLKRAGLDYWKYLDINVHDNYNDYKNLIKSKRLIGFSRFSKKSVSTFKFKNDDVLMFGREDNGLPQNIKDECYEVVTIPMPGGCNEEINKLGVRSLNLSVSVGIAIYKAYESIQI